MLRNKKYLFQLQVLFDAASMLQVKIKNTGLEVKNYWRYKDRLIGTADFWLGDFKLFYTHLFLFT